MASFRKRGNVWYYRYVDADGAMRERKGCPDRQGCAPSGAHGE